MLIRTLKLKILLVLITLFSIGCVTNETVDFIQKDDYGMSCSELKNELSSLGVSFEYNEDQSGFSVENIIMAIVYWPGIFYNEGQASINKESIEDRISHLTAIYETKCRKNIAR